MHFFYCSVGHRKLAEQDSIERGQYSGKAMQGAIFQPLATSSVSIWLTLTKLPKVSESQFLIFQNVPSTQLL